MTGSSAAEGTLLMVALAVAVMIWSALRNAVFDWADLRLSGRMASDRPHCWRVVDAISHEATSIVVTLPIMIWLGGFGIWGAFLAEIALTLTYTVYADVFHVVYDRVRPVVSA